MKQKFKLKTNRKALIIILLLIFSASAKAQDRIRSIRADKGKIEKISMVPGLASVITFPCDIDEAIIGRDQDLKAVVSPTTKKQLTLYLTSASSQSTNLLVRCGDRRDLFVFDVVANRKSHQDELKIASSQGAPSLDIGSVVKEIESSSKFSKPKVPDKKPRTVIDVSPKELIEERK